MQQLPGSLRPSPSFDFVGRTRELDVLRTLLPRAPGDGRGVALIAGEAGSGKSRLVRELAQELAQEGTPVLYGACDSAVRAPYRPFVDALQQLVRRTDGVVRVRLSGLSLEEIAEFVRGAAGVEPGEQLVTTLRDLTAGNPFLLTELWRELLDCGSVDAADGVLQLTRPAAELGTPDT